MPYPDTTKPPTDSTLYAVEKRNPHETIRSSETTTSQSNAQMAAERREVVYPASWGANVAPQPSFTGPTTYDRIAGALRGEY